jgi:glycolate dehydrogenase FAD-binding subunit
MELLKPETPEELAEALLSAASAGQSITLGGAFSKNGMAGPLPDSGVRISTAGLNRVLKYEPRDLTISVEAGMPYMELTRILAANGQMIPLDPPFFADSTVGGVLAANTCGPRRRLYGTPRDMVIGMKFATVEGKLVQAGGMVVKNVAGLDMAKLMIGSFGTLAAIAVANFKLTPAPPFSRSFALAFDSCAEAVAARDGVLHGVLQPAAIDLLNPEASALLGRSGYQLILQAGGNKQVMERYARDLAGAEVLEAEAEKDLWRKIRNFTPDFLRSRPDGAVVRASCSLSQVGAVMDAVHGPVLARAGNGVCYGYFSDCQAAGAWVEDAARRLWRPVIEFSPEDRKRELNLWPCPGDDLAVMKKVKHMFDPGNLLNPGRLYGRI